MHFDRKAVEYVTLHEPQKREKMDMTFRSPEIKS